MKVEWDGIGILLLALSGFIIFFGFYLMLTSFYNSKHDDSVGLAVMFAGIALIPLTLWICDWFESRKK